MRKLIIRSTVFLSVVALVMASYLYKQIFSPLSHQDNIILIPTNSSFEQVKDTLQNYGLVKNEFVFDIFCDKKNYIKMRPGRYLIPAEMDANTMVNMLRLGEQKPLNIIFNNASTLQDLAGKLATQIEADSLSLLKAFTDELFYSTYDFDEASMRKLFIPNTYEVYWTITPVEFLERMQKEYKRFWSEDRLIKATKLGLNAHEVSVLASIVQKESAKADEQPIVAGLYLNRLNQGMKLQSDPTVIYSIKERDGFDAVIKRVLKKDLKIDSPYNTYYYKGLPPNPICIPEMSALVAVLNSKKHDYIYMCAKEDFSGYHNFTKSWSVHKRNAKRFQNALSAKGVMR
jgi:UPF0755 protein